MNRPRKTGELIPQGQGADRNGEESAPLTPEASEAYINRELSWLDFAQRVMALAQDGTVPLLERVKFARIMGMLYDEFAMKRIGGLRRRIEHKNTQLSPEPSPVGASASRRLCSTGTGDCPVSELDVPKRCSLGFVRYSTNSQARFLLRIMARFWSPRTTCGSVLRNSSAAKWTIKGRADPAASVSN